MAHLSASCGILFSRLCELEGLQKCNGTFLKLWLFIILFAPISLHIVFAVPASVLRLAVGFCLTAECNSAGKSPGKEQRHIFCCCLTLFTVQQH